jgi:hypothetical protein
MPKRRGGCRREVAHNACRPAGAVTPSSLRRSSRLGRRTEAWPRQLQRVKLAGFLLSKLAPVLMNELSVIEQTTKSGERFAPADT